MHILHKKIKSVFMSLGLIAMLGLSTTNISAQDYSQYADPFIGTGGHGHTFPGATSPFGLVQLSPDTGVEGWDWCSGYHVSDSSIIGFSHTHLSGTGGADYGDILLMPTVGAVHFNSGTKADPDAGYRSRFSHRNEKASPGYYSVRLQDYNIDVELTTTLRTGMHKYTFRKSDQSNIILDLKHGISDNATDTKLTVISDTKLEGYRFSQGWAGDQRVYFAIELSKPFDAIDIAKDDAVIASKETANGKNVKAALTFTTTEGEVILAKVAISSVSSANAWGNMEAENNEFDFEKTHANARALWNKEFAKIQVEGSKKDMKVFYSAMYHTKIHPNIFEDVNGEYRGMDMEVHTADDRTNYTLYSLWDTFRALHPLYSIIDQSYNDNFIKSMISKYEESGKLPVWELWNNETNTMIGYHSIPVIADAILKGYYTGDVEKAYEAMLVSANADNQGLKFYKHQNYIPREHEANSVSKTVEYAFDDYAIAQVAKLLGKEADYKKFTLRSYNYKNLFDTDVNFMRGRDENGVWDPEFDPMAISLFGSGDFTEGNSWHYSFFAPHDMTAMVDLFGGKENFVAKLDEMFEQEAVNDNAHAHDVTGLIGQYAQGNEPSHHVVYTYNFAQRPDKTQEMIRKVMNMMYTTERDGYSGNEDTGQMSAWYVFSSMGFYPMNPASGQYIIGSPVFDKTTINMESGKNFVIEAKNNSPKNVYIKSATLNGKAYTKTFLKHADIMNGGHLVFEMSPTPQAWGSNIEDCPVELSLEKGETIEFPQARAFMPYAKNSKYTFQKTLQVALASETEGVKIYYTLDGSTPSTKSKKYKKAFTLKASTELKAISVKDDYITSDVKTINFRKSIYNSDNSAYPIITTDTKLGKTYNPGVHTLIDGITGSNNYTDGKWTGIQGDDFRGLIDFGKATDVSRVTINFSQNTGSWIFPPRGIQILSSDDGKNFTELASVSYPETTEHLDIIVLTKSVDVKASARYLKVVIKDSGDLPTWHGGSGLPSYMFIDEITVEQ